MHIIFCALDEEPPDIVVVHDGCRIFVTSSELNTIATEAFKNGVRIGFFNHNFDKNNMHLFLS